MHGTDSARACSDAPGRPGAESQCSQSLHVRRTTCARGPRSRSPRELGRGTGSVLVGGSMVVPTAERLTQTRTATTSWALVLVDLRPPRISERSLEVLSSCRAKEEPEAVALVA